MLKVRLTADDLAVIRLNKKNLYKSSSEGDIFLHIVRKANADSSMRKIAFTEFKSWAITQYGAEATKCQRLSIILSTTRYGALMQDIVETL